MAYDDEYSQNISENRRVGYIITFVLTVLAFIVAVHFLSGCNSEKRIARKALTNMDKTNRKYEEKSNIDTVKYHWCSINAPMKVGQGKTVYLPGKKVVTEHHDTVIRKVPHTDTVLKTITITKHVHTVDTVKVRDTVISTSEVKLLEAKLEGLSADNIKAWDTASKARIDKAWWQKAALWTWGILLAIIICLILRVVYADRLDKSRS